MFATPLAHPKGINPRASWAESFQAALDALTSFTAATAEQALDKSLEAWERGSAGLALDQSYQPKECYCIRQQVLWKIYARLKAGNAADAGARKIYNRAKDVLEETPEPAQPGDLTFTQGDGLIEKMLQHLKAVDAFYQNLTQPDTGLLESAHETPGPALPPTSDGFLCTLVLKTGMDAGQARRFWQQFLAQNTQVRMITLGSDALAQDASTLADPIFFSPGGAQKPGRCLWVQIADVQPDVRQWLQSQGFAQPEQARCIFVKASGALSAVLKASDIIDETAVLDEFFNASA